MICAFGTLDAVEQLSGFIEHVCVIFLSALLKQIFQDSVFFRILRSANINRRFPLGIAYLLAGPLKILESFPVVGKDVDGVAVELRTDFSNQSPDPHPLTRIESSDTMNQKKPLHIYSIIM